MWGEILLPFLALDLPSKRHSSSCLEEQDAYLPEPSERRLCGFGVGLRLLSTLSKYFTQLPHRVGSMSATTHALQMQSALLSAAELRDVRDDVSLRWRFLLAELSKYSYQ